MEKQDLITRAENRRKLAQAVDTPPVHHKSLTEEIGTYWLHLAVQKWNPAVQKEIPEGVPVGKDGMTKFIDEYLKKSGFKTREWDIASIGAEHVARWIDHHGSRVVGVDFPNPITGIEKSKGKGGYVVASTKKTAKSIYDGVEHDSERYRNMYAKPEEHCRTCPEHAGIQMRRVSDGVYQCPMSGDTYSYTGGHKVEYKIGVHNQTNKGWNKTWSQPAFLTTPNQQSHDHKSLKEFGDEKPTKFIVDTPELYANASIKKAQSLDCLTEPGKWGGEVPTAHPDLPFKNEGEALLYRRVCEYLNKMSKATGKSPAELANTNEVVYELTFKFGEATATQITNILQKYFGRQPKSRRRQEKHRTEQELGFPVNMGSSNKEITKQAKVNQEVPMFGPVQVQTRYCPDHDSISLYRIADKVYQCPLDRQVYDFEKGFTQQDGTENLGGSVAEMTPDSAEFYQKSANKTFKHFMKQAQVPLEKSEEYKKREKQQKQVSGLRPFAEQAKRWMNPGFPLDQAKAEFKEILTKAFAHDPKSLESATQGIEEAKTAQKLLEHFWHLLMKFEGQGVYKPVRASLNKSALSNLDNRFAFDLSHLITTNSADSKKVVSLVVNKVIQQGLALTEAISEAYKYIDEHSAQEKAAPSTQAPLEVKEEELNAPQPDFDIGAR